MSSSDSDSSLSDGERARLAEVLVSSGDVKNVAKKLNEKTKEEQENFRPFGVDSLDLEEKISGIIAEELLRKFSYESLKEDVEKLENQKKGWRKRLKY